MLLQSMTGNLSIPGGCETGCSLVNPARMPFPMVDWQRAEPEYEPPMLRNILKISDAILNRPKYDSGEMTEDEYRRSFGSPPGSPLPNIKMVWMKNQHVTVLHHANKRMEALAATEFNWGFQGHFGMPGCEFMDILLPYPLVMFETMDNFMLGSEKFMYGPNGMRNYFLFCNKVCEPPGEVRPMDWVWTQLANRLGIGHKYNPRLYDVALEDWDDAVRELYREAYEEWAEDEYGFLEKLKIDVKPWDEFLKEPVVRIPIKTPFYPFRNHMEKDQSPFDTPTGLIEFSSKYVESTDMVNDSWYRGEVESIPTWDPPYMKGNKPNDSFYNPNAAKYPLSMVTPVSIYRQHAVNDENIQLRDCYRHAVWVAPSDAKARGIVDGETVRAYNQFGELNLPAYVTSRMQPGTAAIFHGVWYEPNEEITDTMPYGVDTRGNCNFLIGDSHAPHIVGALHIAGLIEVEKIKG